METVKGSSRIKIVFALLVASIVVVAGVITASSGKNSRTTIGITSNSSTTTANSSVSIQYTTTGESSSCTYPNGEGGPVYLKLISDQGSIITNGSAHVTHDSVCDEVANYLLPLTPNATGYTLMSLDNLWPVGVYNITLTVGYGADNTYTASIFVLQSPEVSCYVAISVPSGQGTSTGCYFVGDLSNLSDLSTQTTITSSTTRGTH